MTASATNKPNALIFGLGAIGGVYASLLKRSEAVNVAVVARSNYQTVKDKGFNLDSQKFGKSHHEFDAGELGMLSG